MDQEKKAIEKESLNKFLDLAAIMGKYPGFTYTAVVFMFLESCFHSFVKYRLMRLKETKSNVQCTELLKQVDELKNDIKRNDKNLREEIKVALDTKTEVMGEMMRELRALRSRDDQMTRDRYDEIKRNLELMKSIEASLRTMCESFNNQYGSGSGSGSGFERPKFD